MGRSVSVLSDARHVTYFEYPTFTEPDEDEGQDGEEREEPMEWEWVVDDLTNSISEAKLEFDAVKKKWDGNEVSILFENEFAQIGFSEYCGLCSFAIRVNEEPFNYLLDDEIADALKNSEDWIDEHWGTICKAIGYKQLTRVGGFSDGTSVYELVNKEL